MFMPSREIHAGEYRDICFPITSELYKQIKDSVLEAYARPEDDDPAYGDNPEMAEKTERMGEVPASAIGQGRRGIAPENSGQTREVPEADAVVVPETGVLQEDGRKAENPEECGLSEGTVQPEDTAQHSQ